MKKAIVTGATGFIGSSFVEHLLREGIEVIAIGRKDIAEVSFLRRKKLYGARYVRLCMEEILSLGEVLSAGGIEPGEDCVFFNLAWGGNNCLSDLDVASQLRNVDWCLSALEVASKINCSRFIQVGTMEEAFARKYLTLDHSKHNQYNRHVIYAVAKIAAKTVLTVRASQIGMDFIYVLHSHIMGPGDDKNSFLQVTLEKLIHGDELIFSTGEQYFDVTAVHDCCLGYRLICEKGKPGQEYWVGSGDPRRLREYVERMYKMYPSGAELQFGRLPYNDVTVDKDVFSTADLVRDTGYAATMTYEQAVAGVHEYLEKQ